jgi:hypothetical protein
VSLDPFDDGVSYSVAPERLIHDHVENHCLEGEVGKNASKADKPACIGAAAKSYVGMLEDLHDIIEFTPLRPPLLAVKRIELAPTILGEFFNPM